ncbi:RrF2 family transcriptional regulator [Algisphaera agarilytica]|uniref:Rrf2 family protein n=1 Tax=Algisphaera agarilytica TaxID=1385975 RepID=A0A7X0LKM8_9BACT|nr:Rrf2 family transcriptional regulator [Algisphaera agarilytica]MBB6429796.1 Rrf2 family protein [Algisphaera agarilytica]
MKLTKTSAQAALAMGYLAEQTATRPTQARQVAEHLGIPTDSTLKILQTLVRQQLLRSQLGRSGGYQMLVPAEYISLLQIVEAIDGPINTELPLDSPSPEVEGRLSLLHDVCMRSTEHLRRELSSVTVADLMNAAKSGAPVLTPASYAIAG